MSKTASGVVCESPLALPFCCSRSRWPGVAETESAAVGKLQMRERDEVLPFR